MVQRTATAQPLRGRGSTASSGRGTAREPVRVPPGGGEAEPQEAANAPCAGMGRPGGTGKWLKWWLGPANSRQISQLASAALARAWGLTGQRPARSSAGRRAESRASVASGCRSHAARSASPPPTVAPTRRPTVLTRGGWGPDRTGRALCRDRQRQCPGAEAWAVAGQFCF